MPRGGNRAVNHSGRQFGYWTAISYAGPRVKNNGGAAWLCVCVCGAEKIISAESLTRGKSKSCGCMTSTMRSRSLTTHGATGGSGGKPSGAYRSWHAMRQRCENKKHKQYLDYGGRGITVCVEWQNFAAFLADMGERPEGKTLDRINPNGNYEPANCRWSSIKEQAANKRPRVKHSDLLEIVGTARAVILASNDNLSSAIAELRSAINNLDGKAA